MIGSAIAELDGVTRSYVDGDERKVVLEDVDLRLCAGDKVSLVGPSGSGKSTLLSLVAGLLTPDRGVVRIDGTPTSELDDAARAGVRARRIGIALQRDNLISFLTASENIELALGIARGTTGRAARLQARQHATALLDTFGVAHRCDHRPRHLSGGEAQRVALAVALANGPGLLLADEIAAGLDAVTAAHVIEHLLGVDVAVLYVTHDRALADLADRRLHVDGATVAPR